MSYLKSNRTRGKNSILPEMLKSCDPHRLDNLCNLFATVRRKGRVLSEWRDVVLVPISIRRGTCHLVTIGDGSASWMRLARYSQGSFSEEIAEELVSDSQCSFCKGKGCVDIIFCVRQLVEKANCYLMVFSFFVVHVTPPHTAEPLGLLHSHFILNDRFLSLNTEFP